MRSNWRRSPKNNRLRRSGLSRPGSSLSETEYEDFLALGDPDFAWKIPDDEWDAITLNYTSGTTGNPKGVVYHHRGAYLLSLGNTLAANMAKHPRYLWTLPMFHCDGWCFPWTVPIVAGTQICLRYLRADGVWNALADHKVTHLCGAPIVMSTLLNAPAEVKRKLEQPVEFLTAAAPPPEAVLAEMKEAALQRHACLRSYRGLRARGRQRMEGRMERVGQRRASAKESSARRALCAARRTSGDGLCNNEARASGRQHNWRSPLPRQCRDEGVPQKPRCD